jgi:hypothetical protein
MQSIIKILIVTGLGLLCACASASVQKWRSEPLDQTIAAPGLRVALEPLKENEEFFVGFRLTVRNEGATPLTLDWNQTRYLHNGRDLGLFIYRGIDPASIQGHIPPEVVPAGATFTQEIFPLRTIAFCPAVKLPSKGSAASSPGFCPRVKTAFCWCSAGTAKNPARNCRCGCGRNRT